MKSSKPKTAVFLIGSGIYMIDFYNFEYFKAVNDFRLVAIVNEDVVSEFPARQKCLFDKIYTVRKSSNTSLSHLNYTEVEMIVSTELGYVGNSDNVRIFPFNEYNVLPAAYIRKKFRIPGASPEMVSPFRDKCIMKTTLNENNTRVPRFTSLDLKKLKADSKAIFEELTIKLGLPFVVKPTDGAGGLGVSKIESFNDFEKFKSELLPSVAGYEAEEFLAGDLYHCDIIFKNQKPILTLCAKYNYPLLDFKNGKNVGSIPLLDNNPLKKKLIEFTQHALSCFQLPDGITHTEIFYLPKTEEFVFLESAARAPGSMIVPMYDKTFGFNILDIDFLIHMNHTMASSNAGNTFSFWAVFPPISGRIGNLFEPQLESEHRMEWFAKKGDVLSSSNSMRDRVGRIFVWNKDYDALQRDFEYISKNSFIHVET